MTTTMRMFKMKKTLQSIIVCLRELDEDSLDKDKHSLKKEGSLRINRGRKEHLNRFKTRMVTTKKKKIIQGKPFSKKEKVNRSL